MDYLIIPIIVLLVLLRVLIFKPKKKKPKCKDGVCEL